MSLAKMFREGRFKLPLVALGLWLLNFIPYITPGEWQNPFLISVLGYLYYAIELGVMAWVGMQGVGRWRAMVGGLLFMAYNGITVYAVATIERFSTFDTFWRIDAPSWFLHTFTWVSAIKIGSLLSGIEIADGVEIKRDIPPRWTISRMLWLTAAVAVFVQCSLAQVHWFMSWTGFQNPQSGLTPGPVGTGTQSHWSTSQLLPLLLLAMGLKNVIPILLAGWMLAGKRWRLWIGIGLVIVMIGVIYGLFEAIEWIVKQDDLLMALRFNFDPGLYTIATGTVFSQVLGPLWWTICVVLNWIVYLCLAALVPWMGYRWVDYWTESRSSEDAGAVANP